MQDSHRQKNWASDQSEAARKEAGSRELERHSPDQKDTDSGSRPEPANQNREQERAVRAPEPSPASAVLERGRIFQHDAQALTTSVRESIDLLHRYVSEQVEQRPYTTVGIAAGLGYVLGGGLANRITGSALGTAYRIGLALAARELSSRVPVQGVSGEPTHQDRFPR